MDKIKYVGIDLHQSTCLIAVHDAHGKHITEKIIETRAEALRDFFGDLTGSVHIAVEVGTQSPLDFAMFHMSGKIKQIQFRSLNESVRRQLDTEINRERTRAPANKSLQPRLLRLFSRPLCNPQNMHF